MRKKKERLTPDALFLQHMIGSSEKKNPVVALLEEINTCGSINQAAKSVGMSYKAAWERIENINNVSPKPLISRQVGGSGGGGTVLTEAGHEFVNKAHLLQREFTSFLNFFYFSPEEAFNTLKTLRRIEMKNLSPQRMARQRCPKSRKVPSTALSPCHFAARIRLSP